MPSTFSVVPRFDRDELTASTDDGFLSESLSRSRCSCFGVVAAWLDARLSRASDTYEQRQIKVMLVVLLAFVLCALLPGIRTAYGFGGFCVLVALIVLFFVVRTFERFFATAAIVFVTVYFFGYNLLIGGSMYTNFNAMMFVAPLAGVVVVRSHAVFVGLCVLVFVLFVCEAPLLLALSRVDALQSVWSDNTDGACLPSGDALAIPSSPSDACFDYFYRRLAMRSATFAICFSVCCLALAAFSWTANGISLQAQRTFARFKDARRDARRFEGETRKANRRLAVTSHELGNELTSFGLALDLIWDNVSESDNAELVSSVGVARTHLDYMSRIVRNFLDAERLEHGAVQLSLADFSLRGLLEELAVSLAPELDWSRVCFVLDVDPGLFTMVRADRFYVRQIVKNFLKNAVRFTGWGSITLRLVRRLSSSASASSCSDSDSESGSLFGHASGTWESSSSYSRGCDSLSSWRIEVVDTGIGVASGDLERVFAQFEQADTTTTRKYGGSGLGLFICRQLAELMDGSVGVRSQLDVGSTFYVDLPLLSAPLSLTNDDRCRVLAASRLVGVENVLIGSSSDAFISSVEQLLRHACGSAFVSRVHVNVVRAGADVDELLPDMDLVIFDSSLLSVDGADDERRLFDTDCTLLCVPPRVALQSERARSCEQIRQPLEACAFVDAIDALLSRRQHASRAASRKLGRVRTLRSSSLSSPLRDASPSGKARVLIVDDHASIRTLMQQVLVNNFPCDVSLAADGIEAVDVVKAQAPFDVIIIDHEMPRMNGCEATRAIRAWERKQKCASPAVIVAISGNTEQKGRELFFKAGANEFFQKPVKVALLKPVFKKISKKC